MAIYTIKSQASGFCLNVNGNTQVSPHRNVNVYRPMGSDDQNWVIGSFSGNQLIKSNISASYALNAYRVGSPWNCDIYPWSGNLNDAEVCFESVSSNVYRIRLAHHAGYYLTAQGAASGSNVVWAAKNGSSIYQQWRVERVSGPTPPPTPPTPSGGKMLNVQNIYQYDYRKPPYNTAFGNSACYACCYLAVANYDGHGLTMMDLINIGDVDGNSALVNRCTYLGVESTNVNRLSLAAIKSQIDNNRPVIVELNVFVGEKRDQHFFVVKGYTGNGTTQDDFKVMDPGYNPQETTLDVALTRNKPYYATRITYQV